MGAIDFERLFDQHARSLLSFLTYRTGDRLLAEDLVADTFERALRGRGRFDQRRGGEKTWLYSIALNLYRDHLRRQKVEQRTVETADRREPVLEEGESINHVEDRASVRRALAILTEEERETVVLRFGGDFTVPEIASLTRERLTTVEGRLYRALRKMRKVIE